MEGPFHCPSCGALVVDRRFAACTTCQTALPPEWVLTPEQISQLQVNDAHARAEHAAALDQLEPPPGLNDSLDLEDDV